MEARRASIISNSSFKSRKYSTDRVLRQAELSARLEEARLLIFRPDDIHEESVGGEVNTPVKENVQQFVRVDSLVSPFDVHPGQRLVDYPFDNATDAESSADTGLDYGATRPWEEPTDAQLEDIERRAAVSHRVETASLDLSRARAHLAQGVNQVETRNPVQKLLRKMNRPRTDDKTTTFHALNIINSTYATMGLGLAAQKSSGWFQRKQLHILQYKLNGHRSFSCESNNALGSTAAFKQHLVSVSEHRPESRDGEGIRIIRICNNEEALKYIDEAFAISNADVNLGEKGFTTWMQDHRDSRRASNMTIRWRPAFDTKRQVMRMAIGIDLGVLQLPLEPIDVKRVTSQRSDIPSTLKRRIAVYLQRSPSQATPQPNVPQFNSRGASFSAFAKQDSIVICEYASDAWSEIIDTPSLLALTPIPGVPTGTSASVIASTISHMFWEVVAKWESRIANIHQPFLDLEELVYSQPSDASQALQIWEWFRYLQTMLKLAVRHLKAIQTFQDDFAVFAEHESVEWLGDVLDKMLIVSNTLREDYIDPLEHMIDLTYKSAAIRDSRMSLELGTSLWRLSWITFIFLPLTFLVGFFGMNVDLFKNDPSIKWYFVGLVPLLVLVMTCWTIFQWVGQNIYSDPSPRLRRGTNSVVHT